MWDADKMPGRVQTSIMMRDLDGSLTGEAGNTVVKKNVYYTKDLNCKEKEGWSLDVCKERFLKVNNHPDCMKFSISKRYFLSVLRNPKGPGQ